jgi:hypothetical protein
MTIASLPKGISIGDLVAIQAVRYLAASQAFAMVAFHAGWVLLSLATWGHASGPDTAVGDTTRALVRAYAWLGGVDESGRGDERSLMAVWAKLGLVIYAIEALWRWVFGQRKPIALWRIAAASWLVAQLGYIGALVPTGDLRDATLMLIAFPVLAGVSTAWSVAAHRLATHVEDLIRRKQVAGRARKPG